MILITKLIFNPLFIFNTSSNNKYIGVDMHISDMLAVPVVKIVDTENEIISIMLITLMLIIVKNTVMLMNLDFTWEWVKNISYTAFAHCTYKHCNHNSKLINAFVTYVFIIVIHIELLHGIMKVLWNNWLKFQKIVHPWRRKYCIIPIIDFENVSTNFKVIDNLYRTIY